MVQAVGVDWATEAAGRGAVVIEVDGARLVVTGVHPAGTISDEEVARLVNLTTATVVAVDIPFGWPASFATFVNDWSALDHGPAVPTRSEFRHRATDRVVNQSLRQPPMAVSADKFAMGARLWAELARGNGWTSRIDVHGSKVGRTPAPIIEVYPAATLRALGAHVAGYKGTKDAPMGVRIALLDRLVSAFEVSFAEGLDQAALTRTDNELDAFLSALTGLAYHGSLPGWTISTPAEDQRTLAAREGWIFYPVKRTAPER